MQTIERRKQYRIENKERLAKAQKRYYQKNKQRFTDAKREWVRRNPERNAATCRAYYHKNRERIAEYRRSPEYRALALEWRKGRGSLSDRNTYLRYRFGISLSEYESMLANQKGVCAICKRPPGRIRLAVDHCSSTGRIRGLLCHKCNVGIGYFDHSVQFIHAAARYLLGCHRTI
jgi:hypothetical protein